MKWPFVRALLFGCMLPSLVMAATPSTPPPVTQGVMTYYWDGTKSVAVTAGNPLPVTGGGGGGGGTSAADESAFVAGTTAFTPMGGFFQTTATSNPLTNGQAGWTQLTANRASMVNLRNAAGAELGVAAAPVQVSLANTATNATPVGVAGTGTAGTANAGVVTVQGIASMTKLLVTPDSVALPANQSVNTAQVNGVTTLTGAGATGTGSQRVTAAQDTTTIAGSAPGTAGTASANVVTVQGVASMTKLLVTPDSVALPANQSVNEAQINGVAPLMGNGVTGTGSSRVTIASDNSPVAGLAAGATAAAPPANAIYNGANGSGATGGQLQGLVVCDKYVFKHITSATDTLAVQGVASQTIRVCGVESRAAGVATWFLENTASANANCSSANTQIAILNTEAANTGMVSRSPFWNGLSNTSGNGLCINSTGTGGVDVGIYYAQF